MWILSRPRLSLYVLLLVVVGYRWAHWDRGIALPLALGSLVWVLAGWALLHAGTMWLNAALDQDEGEVLYGRPVPVPRQATLFGHLALGASVVLAFCGHPLAGIAASLCAVLSILYSHPRTQLKAHPLGGPFVNAVGYGLLTPLAGWAVVGFEANMRTYAVWPIGVLGVLGCYFAAQAFQEKEDRARGYSTLVVTHGPKGAIRAARLSLTAMALLGIGLAVAGWLPRLLLLATPLAFWVEAWLRKWERDPKTGGERQARGLVFRLVVSGAACLVLLLADYWHHRLTGQPVAGLGTIAARPDGGE